MRKFAMLTAFLCFFTAGAYAHDFYTSDSNIEQCRNVDVEDVNAGWFSNSMCNSCGRIYSKQPAVCVCGSTSFRIVDYTEN